MKQLLKPLTVALKGKGPAAVVKRARKLTERYGLTAAKMDQTLGLFVDILQQYNCGASFPITSAALARNGPVIKKYQAKNIEFGMHGLFHVDYSQLPFKVQQNHLDQAKQIFKKEKIKLSGFRCPYLRWNYDTLDAIAHNNLSYDSSQALYWDVVTPYNNPDYQRVLEFYRAKPAEQYPALPKIIDNIVQIPYSVPDDEALIDRLKLTQPDAMRDIWLAILQQTYALGELFILGLHPERIKLLQKPLAQTLAQARSLSPAVWIARLDEIAQWWCVRSQASFKLNKAQNGSYSLEVEGPPDITILARHVDVKAATLPGPNNFSRVMANKFYFQSQKRPWIGLSPDSSPALLGFLKQQGYWVDFSPEGSEYSIYLHQPNFSSADERPLLKQLATSEVPLICLGRWPGGAQSAMCVSGDIDALTLWDYGLRFLGR